MATFSERLTRLRRFLRDPDGLVWTDADLRTYFSDAQVEIIQKTHVLELVRAYKFPPQIDFAYMYDHEKQYLTGKGDNYQCLTRWLTRKMTICHPHEAAYFLQDILTNDDGMRCTYPWGYAYRSDVAEPCPIPLHAQLDRVKFAAYDETAIEPITERELSAQDNYYKTARGTATHYYFLDETQSLIALYNQPETLSWQEYDYADVLADDGGIIAGQEDRLNESNEGVTVEMIDTADALFMIATIIPRDISSNEDILEWPDWLLKYVEYATLERAFGADTDGFIPSLRDYWRGRKELGLKAIEKFKRMRLEDRDFVLSGGLSRRRKEYPRLPDGYADF